MTTTAWTIERQIHFRHAGHGRGKQVRAGPAPEGPSLPLGRVPRVAKLMALALRFDELLGAGEIASCAELARLGHVTRARLSQIMNLLLLSPDIVEEVLHLSATTGPAVLVADLQPIAGVAEWREQRRLWRALLNRKLTHA